MTQHAPLVTPAPDLRERRRRALVRAIAMAAIELFERHGFAATTVDAIAAAAGISRTTFFRHCASKEAAVLVDDAGLEPVLVAAAGEAPMTRSLHHLETVWGTVIQAFDDDSDGCDRFLRVHRLLRATPSLRAAALERQARLTEGIAAALAGAGHAALDAHAIAATFSTGMQLAFDEWARRADGDSLAEPASLRAVYREVRVALARANEVAAP